MRIGINATCFNDTPSGAKKRFLNIYFKVFNTLNNIEFIIFEPIDCNISNWFEKSQNIKFVKTKMLSTNSIQRYLYGLFLWPKYFKEYKFDLFDWYHLPLTVKKNTNIILTIHDLRYLEIPKYYSIFRSLIAKRVIQSSISNAKKIVTVSKTMHKSISRLENKDKISVIYNGLDQNYGQELKKNIINNTKKKYNLNFEFILTVGSLEKRKNLSVVLKSIGLLNSLGYNKKLVIVGGLYNDSSNIIETRELLDLNNDVVILNEVNDLELKCLYKLANTFVFPSIYEGFGIPLLEAMFMKCPVIASDIECFRELGKSYINYFDPKSEEDLCYQLLRIENNKKEILKKIDKAYERSLEFNYESIAQKVISIYKELNYKLDK